MAGDTSVGVYGGGAGLHNQLYAGTCTKMMIKAIWK
jgi:hypothetical protein